MEEVMKKYIIAASLAVLCASPAFAGGSKGGGGGLLGIGAIIAPITTAVSALNITALNNVSVLGGGVNVLNNNKTNVSTVLPISLRNTNILSGLLGGGSSHGCGCN